ncbi:Oxidoreductase, short-chain dehydrogenase/reductase family [hydrothermal vent metagenome]|uniref:Oxidoreductase, short-chain dehydrogenase/reductase family n=1 Tax=hydrothermal vent metagenome TaxID=652676 RepID=A0A3B0ZRX3_9ZZZZ
MSKILILGATSAIAEQFARLYTRAEHELLLVGRNTLALEEISRDLEVRGVGQVNILSHDFTEIEKTGEMVEKSYQILGDIDIALIAFGSLPDQIKCNQDSTVMQKEILLNFNAIVVLLNELAMKLEQQRSGSIVVISSVAGDRGRQSNYIYGSAKGGLSIFMQGLRNRLASYDVQVLTVKPGFVDTPMTKSFEKGLLWVGPDKIAKDISRAIEKKKDVLYTPWFWWGIILIIRFIPEKIFKKLKL